MRKLHIPRAAPVARGKVWAVGSGRNKTRESSYAAKDIVSHDNGRNEGY